MPSWWLALWHWLLLSLVIIDLLVGASWYSLCAFKWASGRLYFEGFRFRLLVCRKRRETKSIKYIKKIHVQDYETNCRVPTFPGKPGKPWKMRVHLENLEKSWNFVKNNKNHGKIMWNLEKYFIEGRKWLATVIIISIIWFC